MSRDAKNRDLIGVGRRPEGERPTISSFPTLKMNNEGLNQIHEELKQIHEAVKQLSLKISPTEPTKKSKNKA